MDKHALFDLWAPPASPWATWAKPTLFSHLPADLPSSGELPAYEVASWPPAAGRYALVLDLPGAESVRAGLALAARGYRPVPLFNACPAPPVFERLAPPAVEVGPTLRALAAGAAVLGSLTVPADAPPVFLLDLGRADARHRVGPGTFDNRSVVFASDFPSAAFLRQHQIARVVLVHAGTQPVADDLRHALRHWKLAGLPVDVISPTGESLPVTWPGNGFLGELAVRCFALFRLRRNAQGGYGAFVPETSGG